MNEEEFTDSLQEEISEFGEDGGVAVETDMPQEAEISEPVSEAAVEKQIAEQEAQYQRLLSAIDEALERRSRRQSDDEHKRPRTRSERAGAVVSKKGVGFVSLGLILVFMGIVMIATLSAATPNYTIPLKLSPICAVLIGMEILITQALTNGKLRVSVPSLIISVIFVAGCCTLSAVLGGDYREEVVEYNNRTIAGEIYDMSYEELKGLADITKVKVDVSLNPDGKGKLKGVEALSSSDIVDVSVEFGGVYDTPKSFAKDCKKIIDGYRSMGIHVTNFYFVNSSMLRSFTLDVQGNYEQDLSESRLEEMVNYVYVDDYDYIEDLEDYVDASEESSED